MPAGGTAKPDMSECYLFVDSSTEEDDHDPRWPYMLYFQLGSGVARLGSMRYATEEQARQAGLNLLASLQGQSTVS
jgi:hypothetical protein